MLRHVAQLLRAFLLTVGLAFLLCIPVSFVAAPHVVWVDHDVWVESGSYHKVAINNGAFRVHLQDDDPDRPEFVDARIVLVPDKSNPPWKDAAIPSVEVISFNAPDDILFIDIPLWLLAAICLAWPVTSFLVARRRGKGRGFAVEAGGGGPAPGIAPPPRRPDNIPPP